MQEILELITEPLKSINLKVYEAKFVKGNPNKLNIGLESNEIIDIDKIVKATKLISPIIDKCDFTNEQYILDVYSKEEGMKKNE